MIVAMTGQCFWRFPRLPGQCSWLFTRLRGMGESVDGRHGDLYLRVRVSG